MSTLKYQSKKSYKVYKTKSVEVIVKEFVSQAVYD